MHVFCRGGFSIRPPMGWRVIKGGLKIRPYDVGDMRLKEGRDPPLQSTANPLQENAGKLCPKYCN